MEHSTERGKLSRRVLRWILAMICFTWGFRMLVIAPEVPPDGTRPVQTSPLSDPVTGQTPIGNQESVKVPLATSDPKAIGESPSVTVSPRLQGEIRSLKLALEESLEGQQPLQEDHARYLASWVLNLMLDAAYQDAVDLGRDLDAEHAKAQVLQVLEVKP
jgi:hypothetical protein